MNTLGQRFIWVLSGNSFHAAAQFAIIVALTKLGGAGTVGDYGLAQAIAAPLFMFGHFELRRVLATDLAERFQLGDYLRLQLLSGSLAILASAVFGVLWLREELGLLLAVGAKKTAELMGEVMFGAFQRSGCESRIGFSMALRGVADVGAILTVYRLCEDLVLAVLVACVASSTILVVHDIPVALRHAEIVFSGPSRWRYLVELARYSAPAGATATMTALNSSLPRFFIESYQGRIALGYFVSLSQLLQVGVLANTALSQAALSSLAERYRRGVRGFRKALMGLCFVEFGVQVVPLSLMAVAGIHILTFFYTPDYARHASVAVVLFAGAAVRAVVSGLSAGQTVLGILPQQTLTTAVSLAATFVFSVALVPPFALLGAAAALLGAAVVNVLLNAATVRAFLSRSELKR